MPSAEKVSIPGRRAISSAWREQGVLIQEKAPCVFAYSQRFKVPGSEEIKERRGFIALGKLHDYADQVVFRHEQTLSKPKSDRLNLLKATRAHFGQIFMLYSDPAGSVEQILYDGNGTADAEVTDEYGVVHRVWRISDPAVIRLLSEAMADKKLIIADGHHRYETALELLPRSMRRRRQRAAGVEHEPVAASGVSGSRGDDDVREHGLGRAGDSAHASGGARPAAGSIRRHSRRRLRSSSRSEPLACGGCRRAVCDSASSSRGRRLWR